jgi:hypothetical protein
MQVAPKLRREPIQHTVSVRFRREEAEAITRLSFEDDLTVSAWVRKLVLRSLTRRGPVSPTVDVTVRHKGPDDPQCQQLVAVRFREAEVQQIEILSNAQHLSKGAWVRRVVRRVLVQRVPINGTTTKDEEE